MSFEIKNPWSLSRELSVRILLLHNQQCVLHCCSL